MAAAVNPNGNYAPVNGISMYYEIYGSGGIPLVLIHGGGSTIGTTFGRILPALAKKRKIIAVELQGHGHTTDRPAQSTFEQDADDVAALLNHLDVAQADVFGFSNGGSTALQIAIRYPELVRKLIAASAVYKREGIYSWLWEFLKGATLDNMPWQIKEAYLEITNDPAGLETMHNKDRDRMLNFVDWTDADIQSIHIPTLIIAGDRDIVKPEHAVEMYRLLPQGRLIILPSGHADYIGEAMAEKHLEVYPVVQLVEKFLDGE